MPDSLELLRNLPEYTVSEISNSIKKQVEDGFEYVRVRGEISGLKKHSSGHIYFNLKDENSVLAVVCWRAVASKILVNLEDGLEVLCSGRITTYPGQSKYQMIIESVELGGLGALMALLEKRKQVLAAEGLFDVRHKKPIPFLPEVVGIITSPTGAVIKDILHRLEERFPVKVLLWPVAVQGEKAAGEVAHAIAGFNQFPQGNYPRPDVIIVARGGGSIEDLWPFNEEIVVRAVAASVIPIISAVGHETDTTLIDYVADLRAPTPTAAAEKAVPVRSELRLYTEQLGARLHEVTWRYLEGKKQILSGLARGLPKPNQIIEEKQQRLDNATARLVMSLPNLLEAKTHRLAKIFSLLKHPAALIELNQIKLTGLNQRLSRAVGLFIDNKHSIVEFQARLLDSFHYKKILQRGFVIAKNKTGRVVSSAGSVEPGKPLTLEFFDGEKEVVAAGAAKVTRKTRPVVPEQGDLF